MSPTILLPIDVEGGSNRVITHCFDLAEQIGATVHVLSVVEEAPEVGDLDPEHRSDITASLTRHAQTTSEQVADQASERGLETVVSVREGVANQQIVQCAEEYEPEFIVMGTRAHTHPPGIGSTTERVILNSHSPVVSIPLGEDEAEVTGFDHIIIATDGSEPAERAAERGFDIAERFGANVSIVYVIDQSIYELTDSPRSILGLLKEGGRRAVEDLAVAARERGIDVTTTVRRGNTDQELLEYMADRDGDLAVMGVSGRGGVGNRFLGSTTARVLRGSKRPVLTAR